MALGAAACSTDSYIASRATTVQGKHSWKNCDQLKGEHTSHTKQIDDLTKLMRKAEQDAGGTIIGSAVYGPTLAQAQGERRVVAETMAEKQCPQT